MNNYTSIPNAQYIKNTLVFPEVARFYGLNLNGGNFACCPFHGEKTASFKAYKNGGKCFGCGWGGDVIAFTQEMFGLDFVGALDKLIKDFALGLPIDRPATVAEQRALDERRRAIQAERERDQLTKNLLMARYWAHFWEWDRLDRNRREYAPKATTDELDPRYIEAVKQIDYISYCLDSAQMELYEYIRKR